MLSAMNAVRSYIKKPALHCCKAGFVLIFLSPVQRRNILFCESIHDFTEKRGTLRIGFIDLLTLPHFPQRAVGQLHAAP
jgi:hypothetical protein